MPSLSVLHGVFFRRRCMIKSSKFLVVFSFLLTSLLHWPRLWSIFAPVRRFSGPWWFRQWVLVMLCCSDKGIFVSCRWNYNGDVTALSAAYTAPECKFMVLVRLLLTTRGYWYVYMGIGSSLVWGRVISCKAVCMLLSSTLGCVASYKAVCLLLPSREVIEAIFIILNSVLLFV